MIACSFLALALAGCEETGDIRVLDAPTMVFEREAFPGLDDPRDTILAAMVPHDDVAWVFRLSGQRDEVEAQRERFEAFVRSLSFAEGQALPEWKLPAGWEAIPAAAGSMRQASIRVPVDEGTDLDLSVSELPVREDWLHYRLRNFNRWRRQLQLPVGHASDLQQASASIELASTPTAAASIVTITGAFGQSGPANMGMLAAAPAARSADGPATSVANSGLSYETPPGWQPGPPSSVRRASFVVREGDAEASVSVTAFPKTGRMAEPLANINRWRTEVGMGPIGADGVTGGSEAFEVDGTRGLYVPLDGSDDLAGGLATRAVMVERGELVWFFKMHGPKSLVTRETDHFQDFVRSVEFSQ